MSAPAPAPAPFNDEQICYIRRHAVAMSTRAPQPDRLLQQKVHGCFITTTYDKIVAIVKDLASDTYRAVIFNGFGYEDTSILPGTIPTKQDIEPSDRFNDLIELSPEQIAERLRNTTDNQEYLMGEVWYFNRLLTHPQASLQNIITCLGPQYTNLVMIASRVIGGRPFDHTHHGLDLSITNELGEGFSSRWQTTIKATEYNGVRLEPYNYAMDAELCNRLKDLTRPEMWHSPLNEVIEG